MTKATEQRITNEIALARQEMQHLINNGADPDTRAKQEKKINDLRAKIANR